MFRAVWKKTCVYVCVCVCSCCLKTLFFIDAFFERVLERWRLTVVTGVIAHTLDRRSKCGNSVAKTVPAADGAVSGSYTIDETLLTPHFSVLTIFLLRSNRALKVGPGGVR